MSILAGVLIVLTMLTFLFIIFILYVKRRAQYFKEKQAMQSNFEQELLKTRLEIQEQTFLSISQEIHDNIGQSLSFIKLNLNIIDAYNPQQVTEKINESKVQLTKSIQDLRDLSRTLNTDFINETGLSIAIEQQVQLLQKTGLYNARFNVVGEIYKLQSQCELVVFRVVQELLNNIIKHAEANTVTIQMNYQEDKLSIHLRDNGKGLSLIHI